MQRKTNIIAISALAACSRIFPYCSLLFVIALAFFSSVILFSLQAQKPQLYKRFFLFGFCYTLFVLHWVYIPLTFEYWTFAFIPFSIVLLPLYIGCIYALVGVLVENVCQKTKNLSIIFTLGFSTAEWIISRALSGFTWMNSGYAFASSDIVLQITSIIGINGLGVIAIFCAVNLGEAIYSYMSMMKIDFPRITTCIAPLSFIIIFGMHRLSNKTAYSDISARIVHGSVKQSDKNDTSKAMEVFRLYERLSIKDAKKVDLIIWPEACFPFVYSRKSDNVICKYLNDVLNQCNYLITGIIRKNDSNKYFNSVMCFSKHADSTVIYDKRHLIPFGEYMPLRRFIKLKSIASLISDFSVGTINQTANFESIPSFQTLICYESIFSHEFRRGQHAKFVLNITNDGWFSKSNENFQHNNISRVISVEHGLPMIRCNNYGISSVFDAYGRNIANVTEQGYLNISIPCAIKQTYYSKSPDLLYHISLLLLFLCEIAFFIL